MAFVIKKLRVGHKCYKNGKEVWRKGSSLEGNTSIIFKFKHDSPKDIKYAWFTFVAFNKFGDFIVGDSGEEPLILYDKVTGPIPANQFCSVCFENMFQNYFIRFVEVCEISVLYMDDTEELISHTEIRCKKQGCYVATAVYGSYDCPEVWTLRRFRDYTLAETWYGRAFIKIYYAISPTLVKWFGHTEWFKKMWRGRLDRMVKSLNANGVENTPYEDKLW